MLQKRDYSTLYPQQNRFFVKFIGMMNGIWWIAFVCYQLTFDFIYAAIFKKGPKATVNHHTGWLAHCSSLACSKSCWWWAGADLSLGAVKVNHLNPVVVGVHPVEDPLRDVQAQTVGPKHCFAGQEHVSVGAVHPSPLNFTALALLGVLLPVCPVHPPEEQTLAFCCGILQNV